MNFQLAKTMLAHSAGSGSVHHNVDRARAAYRNSMTACLLDQIDVGDITVAELLRQGDFGVGTFNHFDGEMVVLDGTCYRLHLDGSASLAKPRDLTPFALVTPFVASTTTFVGVINRDRVMGLIDGIVADENLFSAIRIDGSFRCVTTRTASKHGHRRPTLVDATAAQGHNQFAYAVGTVAGFRTPDYEQEGPVADYHLHFIDRDRAAGGRVVDFEVEQARVAVSTLSRLHLSLPHPGAFRTPEFSMYGQASRAHG